MIQKDKESKKYKEIAEIIIDLKTILFDIKQFQSSNPLKYQAINYRINNMISKLIYEDKEIKKFIHELLKEENQDDTKR
jgi:hypothetical protein